MRNTLLLTLVMGLGTCGPFTAKAGAQATKAVVTMWFGESWQISEVKRCFEFWSDSYSVYLSESRILVCDDDTRTEIGKRCRRDDDECRARTLNVLQVKGKKFQVAFDQEINVNSLWWNAKRVFLTSDSHSHGVPIKWRGLPGDRTTNFVSEVSMVGLTHIFLTK